MTKIPLSANAELHRGNSTTLDLSIVMVNWNTRDLTRESLKSIFAQTDTRSMEVILVDNASHDGSAEMVVQEFPDVILHRSETNVGFAAGCNIGIRLSRGRYVLLINTDTVVLDHAIDKLLAYLEANPKVGLVSPKLLWGDGTLQRESVGYFPSLRTAFNLFFMLSRIAPQSKLFGGMFSAAPEKLSEVDWVTSAVMLFRREALFEIGLIPEDYKAFAEDVHACLNLHQRNWKIVYYPDAEIIHYTGGTSRILLRPGRYNPWRSFSIYFYRQFGMLRTILLQFMAIFGFSLRVATYAITGFLTRKPGHWNRFRQNTSMLICTLSLLGEMLSGRNWHVEKQAAQ